MRTIYDLDSGMLITIKGFWRTPVICLSKNVTLLDKNNDIISIVCSAIVRVRNETCCHWKNKIDDMPSNYFKCSCWNEVKRLFIFG